MLNKIKILTDKAVQNHEIECSKFNCNRMKPICFEEFNFVQKQLGINLSNDFIEIN